MLTPDPDISPSLFVPSNRERMIYLALQEWALFGKPVLIYRDETPELSYPNESALKKNESYPPQLARILLYWYSVTDEPIFGYDGELRPWSGAFISWLVRNSGISETDFPSTVLHWEYLKFILNQHGSNRFSAHEVVNYSPEPGDLLCAPRQASFIKEVCRFDKLKRGPYHCDVVVHKTSEKLDVIGGNVLDAVTLTQVELDDQGHVIATEHRPWVVVIKQKE